MSKKTLQDVVRYYNMPKYLDGIIIKKYVCFEEKLKECRRILDNTTDCVNGKIVSNSPLQYVMFVMLMLKSYTNIEFGDNEINDYDCLESNGIIDLLIRKIPDSEYVLYKTIFDMMRNDLINSYSV